MNDSRTLERIYRAFCEREPSIPLFSQAWWLDATAGVGNWGVALVLKGDEVLASLPYVPKRRYGLRFLGQPALTQNLGPWMRESSGRTSKVLAQQKDWMFALIDQLPPYDRYAQNWSWKVTNWLPFYWKGFEQTSRYTYILHDISDPVQLWAGMQENIRGDIRKAEGRYRLRVRDDLSVEAFLDLNKLTFSRQNRPLPYTDDYVKTLDTVCRERGVRRILIAEDEEGRHHAGVYVVWDRNSAYYLMGGGDPGLRNSGATSLCMWEAIKLSASVAGSFDFEGSMLESVERFFRGFGAAQVPYFSVSRTPSRVLRTARFLRELKIT